MEGDEENHSFHGGKRASEKWNELEGEKMTKEFWEGERGKRDPMVNLESRRKQVVYFGN